MTKLIDVGIGIGLVLEDGSISACPSLRADYIHKNSIAGKGTARVDALVQQEQK